MVSQNKERFKRDEKYGIPLWLIPTPNIVTCGKIFLFYFRLQK